MFSDRTDVCQAVAGPCWLQLCAVLGCSGIELSEYIYSSTSVDNSQTETITYLINKYLLIFLILQSISRYTMFDVISLSFSVHCRCPSTIATAKLSTKRIGKIPHTAGHGGKKRGRGGYISTHLSVWPWRLIVIANVILVGNRLQFEAVVGSDRHKRIVSIRIGYVVPVTSADMQCWCKPLMITCCHQRKRREANMLHALSMASGRCRTIDLLRSLFFFEKKWIKTNEIIINAELYAFYKCLS